jgi:toxin FitB
VRPYLLDTNVVSELRRARPDQRVAAWYASLAPDALYMSVLVLGEIRQGIERLRRRDETQATALESWLQTLKTAYGDRIVPVTTEVAEQWGRLNVPDPLPYVDGLMAATAIVHDWTLATRNTRHVERTGVAVVNPFDDRGG